MRAEGKNEGSWQSQSQSNPDCLEPTAREVAVWLPGLVAAEVVGHIFIYGLAIVPFVYSISQRYLAQAYYSWKGCHTPPAYSAPPSPSPFSLASLLVVTAMYLDTQDRPWEFSFSRSSCPIQQPPPKPSVFHLLTCLESISFSVCTVTPCSESPSPPQWTPSTSSGGLPASLRCLPVHVPWLGRCKLLICILTRFICLIG